MSDHIIELRDVRKSYGQVYALGGVDMHVDRAEVVGLVGATMERANPPSSRSSPGRCARPAAIFWCMARS